MAREKERHESQIRRQLVETANRARAGKGSWPAPAELPEVLAELLDPLAQRSVERQVAAISTWPFNIGTVGRLAAVVTAILAGVLGNVITQALQGQGSRQAGDCQILAAVLNSAP